MNWKIGKFKSVVVSDEKVQNTNFPIPPNNSESQDDEVEYYGGYLICESVANIRHSNIIAAAPDMLLALENIENDDGSIPDHTWRIIKDAIKKAKGL